MALGAAYVTVQELKAYANIPDSIDDTELTRVAAAVSRNVERFCGRVFNDAGSATARTFTPTSHCLVKIDDFSTVTGLVVASDTSDDASYGTTLASTTYWVAPLDGIVDGQTGHPFKTITLRSGSFIVNGRPTVQVTAQWGWAAVPADVKQSVMIQSARIFGRRSSIHGVIGQGDFAFRVSSRMDPDVEDMLLPYRKHVLVA